MEEEVIEKQDLTKIELASLSDRLAAALLDGFLLVVIIFVPFLLIYGFNGIKEIVFKYGMLYNVLMFFIVQCIYLLLNGRLLYKYGQTIGKKYLGIKIVNQENELPSLTKSYLQRNLITGCISIIPIIGSYFSLIDILFIFRKDRRCIHDLIAGTRVIEA